jgi:hypothetical protein
VSRRRWVAVARQRGRHFCCLLQRTCFFSRPRQLEARERRSAKRRCDKGVLVLVCSVVSRRVSCCRFSGRSEPSLPSAASPCVRFKLWTKTLVSPCPSLPTLSTFQHRRHVHHKVARFMGPLGRSGSRAAACPDFEHVRPLSWTSVQLQLVTCTLYPILHIVVSWIMTPSFMTS